MASGIHIKRGENDPGPQKQKTPWGQKVLRFLASHWGKALVGTYALFQLATTGYDWRQLPKNQQDRFGFYPVYYLIDSFQDAVKVSTKIRDTSSNIYADLTGKPRPFAPQEMVTLCIPPSIANEGWDNPAPGSKIASYKDAFLKEAFPLARQRGIEGAPLTIGEYRYNNVVFMPTNYSISDPYNLVSGQSLVSVQTTRKAPAQACPAGHNSYGITTGAQPRVIPLPR